MTLLEFKNNIKIRLRLLKLNIINTNQLEGAALANKWSNVFSTLFYTLAYILFINVIFSNVKVFGGYSKDEMLFLLIIGQLNVFLNALWSSANIDSLVTDVREGNLDLILTKPLPALFYISLRKINIIGIIRDGLPPQLALWLSIHWANIHITSLHLLAGIIIFILGQIAFHCFDFIWALPVFWFGQGDNVRGIANSFDDTNKIPFNAYSKTLKLVFTVVIPVLVASQMSASVMLGKSNVWILMSLASVSAFSFMALKLWFWRIALRNYSSASS